MRRELRVYANDTGCGPFLTMQFEEISRPSLAAVRLEKVAISVLDDYARERRDTRDAGYKKLLSLDATGQLVADVLNRSLAGSAP
jgi:hypothetical protein